VDEEKKQDRFPCRFASFYRRKIERERERESEKIEKEKERCPMLGLHIAVTRKSIFAFILFFSSSFLMRALNRVKAAKKKKKKMQ
jgi:hypothetical protein